MSEIEQRKTQWEQYFRSMAFGDTSCPESITISNSDPVNHPSHYADKQIEVIDYIRDTMQHEHLIGYYWGNIIKYISRWPKKGGVEDLKKARVYLDWLIKEVEGAE